MRKSFRITVVLVAALFAALPTGTALALSISTVTRPDTDSLILQFARPGAYPTISRTGPAEITDPAVDLLPECHVVDKSIM